MHLRDAGRVSAARLGTVPCPGETAVSKIGLAFQYGRQGVNN